VTLKQDLVYGLGEPPPE